MRSYPTLFDGFFKKLHHIGSLHAARFKSLCPGDQDGLHRRAQRGWKRARRPPQPPGPWGVCSRTVTKLRPRGGHITLGNRPRLFSPVYPPTQCISLGAATGKKNPAAHTQTQSVAGQCSGVSQHADLTGVNCTARLHLKEKHCYYLITFLYFQTRSWFPRPQGTFVRAKFRRETKC